MAARPPVTVVAATSASTALSTSSATRTAFRPLLRRSSTTRTAPAASPFCTTQMVRSATSWLRPVCQRRRHRSLSGQGSDIKAGNALPLRLHPGRYDRAQRRAEARRRRQVRLVAPATACSSSRRKATSPPFVFRATEMRRVPIDCRATIGEVGNSEHELAVDRQGRSLAAGRASRPQTRGVAMNPVDHPHGGGEGKYLRWPSPCFALGQARRPYPQQEQGIRRSSSFVVAAHAVVGDKGPSAERPEDSTLCLAASKKDRLSTTIS